MNVTDDLEDTFWKPSNEAEGQWIMVDLEGCKNGLSKRLLRLQELMGSFSSRGILLVRWQDFLPAGSQQA